MDRRSLSRQYKLTPAEIRITEGLLSGMTLKEIAEAGRVKHDTIRTQLKSIFSKADVHSQSQLVALLTHRD